MLQPRIAHHDRSRSRAITISHAARRSEAGESGPISAHVDCVLMTVDQNLMNRQRAYSVATTSFAQEIIFASLLLRIVMGGFPDMSTHKLSFHERREALVFKPDVPGKWLLSDESTKGKSSQIRFLLCFKHGDRLRATRTSFLQGVRELQWRQKDTLVKNCKADMHKRLFLMTSSQREPPTKKLRGAWLDVCPESDDVCFIGGGWESRLSIIRSRLGVRDGETSTKNFLSSLSWRGGMVSALVVWPSRTNVQTSRTRDDPRNTKRQLNASITVCMRVSVCCTNKQNLVFRALGRHSFIALLLKSVCHSYQFGAEKKNCCCKSRIFRMNVIFV